MSNKSFELKKTIVSNKLSNEIHSKDFGKLAKSTPIISLEKIKDIYNSLFYVMSKQGKNSHENIHEESYNYVYNDYNKKLRVELDQKIETQAQKDKELTDLQNDLKNEHPIYENGTFIRAGENGVPYQDGINDTLYIMQEGLLRPFGNITMYNRVRKALELPIDESGVIYVTVPELNQLGDNAGKSIDNTDHLLLEGDDLFADDIVVLQQGAYLDVLLTCDGNERQDSYNLIFGDDPDAAGQYFLDNEGCTVRYAYQQLDHPNLSSYGTVRTEQILIPKNETREVRILYPTEDNANLVKDINYNNVPGMPPPAIQYNGSTVNNYIKLWGEGNEYPSIVYAEGRIRIKEVKNDYIINTLGIAQDHQTIKLLNGLPTEGTGYWEVVSDPDFEALSNHGTRRIYPPGSVDEDGNPLWGSLNQNERLQKLFDDMDNPYYRPSVNLSYSNTSGTFRIYGQPIFECDYYDYNGNKRQDAYVILLNAYCFWDWGYKRNVILFDVETEKRIDVGRKHLVDRDLGMDYKSYSYTIYGMDWSHSFGRKRLVWPGLQGYQLNEYDGSGNLFNPNGNGGSNFVVTNYTKDYFASNL